jgi:glycosyltransferase involved in cell wall biosynthesis
LRIGAEVIVTFDADGQHDPNDIRRLLQPIKVGEAEVVIGSRMLDPRGIGEEEAKGLWDREVKELLAESRLRLTETIPFVFGLNCLYVVEKDSMSNNRQ